MTFGLLYVLLKRFALPQIRMVLEERRDRIHHDFEQAERLKGETEQALANYEMTLMEARAKGKSIASAMHDQLLAELDKQRAKAEAEIAQKLAAAESRITIARSNAQASVNSIAEEIAAAIVAKLIARK